MEMGVREKMLPEEGAGARAKENLLRKWGFVVPFDKSAVMWWAFRRLRHWVILLFSSYRNFLFSVPSHACGGKELVCDRDSGWIKRDAEKPDS